MIEKYIELETSKLKKAKWNYKTDNPKLLEKLKANIQRNGQIENILVREIKDGYEVVNGNHRLDALKQLGFKNVVAYNLGKITQASAMRVAIETNETKFDSDPLKVAETLNTILQEFDLDDSSLTMPFDKTELEEAKRMLNKDLRDYKKEIEQDDAIEIKEKGQKEFILYATAEELTKFRKILSTKRDKANKVQVNLVVRYEIAPKTRVLLETRIDRLIAQKKLETKSQAFELIIKGKTK
jgi:hypothetical protein